MKILYTLPCFIFLFISNAKGQTVSIDSAGYRLSVIFKTKDVIAAANVNNGELTSLANLFQSEENALSNAYNANSSSLQIQQLENQYIAQFQSILTPQELVLYRQNRPESIYGKVIQASN